MSQIDKIPTDMVLSNCEFFCYENEVWIRMADGKTSRVTESDSDLLREMEEKVSTFYPEAYSALQEIYKASSANIPYYRFRMVSRFIRCNFSNLDHVPDISRDGNMNLESVACPLRGECKHDGIVCRPSFAHRMSAAEIRVMGLLYEGLREDDIADRLCLSVLTVRTHIRNACQRLGLHSRAEFMKYASNHNLFHGTI